MMQKLVSIFTCLFLVTFSFSQETEPTTTRILFIFDGSNSMFGEWQSNRKIEVAKKLMTETMEELEGIPNLEVALRMYGHQTKIRPGQQDCSDTKLEVPFAPNNFSKIKSKIRSLEPKGTTPIARSLLEAGEDFPPRENTRDVIILITDGIEACDEDPCAVAKMLKEKGIELRPYVIGIAMDTDAMMNFNCIGKTYDAMTEESFKSVMKVVMSEALNNTTAQVLLNNIKGQPKETDVPMTFYDQKTGKIMYTFMHTLDEFNNPDTLTMSPLYTYKMVVHTTPQVEIKDIKLTPGDHTVIEANTPQGRLDIKFMGAGDQFTETMCVVKKRGENTTLHNQKMNTMDYYLVGEYDIEILTYPRIKFEKVKIEQSRTKKIEIQQNGKLNLVLPSFGKASLFVNRKGIREWVCNLDKEKLDHYINLQPGDYTLVYRPERTRSSAYTIAKDFSISQKETEVIYL